MVSLQCRIHVTPLPFLQYAPLIEFCNQSALGVFQILKAFILTRPIEIHALQLWCKVYEIDPFFYVFVYAQISFMFHMSNFMVLRQPVAISVTVFSNLTKLTIYLFIFADQNINRSLAKQMMRLEQKYLAPYTLFILWCDTKWEHCQMKQISEINIMWQMLRQTI